MSTPVKAGTLRHLDRRIASAAAALSGARAATWHSPNADNRLIEQMCEQVVDELLELRHEMTTATATITT